jgi:hypothetical protein
VSIIIPDTTFDLLRKATKATRKGKDPTATESQTYYKMFLDKAFGNY